MVRGAALSRWFTTMAESAPLEGNRGRLAGGFLPGQSENDRRAGAHQELPGLRRFPARPDRQHHRPPRVRRGHQEDLRYLPEALRGSGEWPEPRRLAGGKTARLDVSVGVDPRKI